MLLCIGMSGAMCAMFGVVGVNGAVMFGVIAVMVDASGVRSGAMLVISFVVIVCC